VRVGRRRERVTAALVDGWHERRGFSILGSDGRAYHIGYHFLILPDGTIERGRPETLTGAHARLHNDMLGVCLVGDFDRHDNPRGRKGPVRPGSAQIRSLEGLLAQLLERYNLAPADIHLHREVVPTTRCPGDSFPAAEVLAAAGRPRRADTVTR
jgi:N-acetyl-anhydromuramyl-L-alanine amidase AmpD